MSSLSVSGNQQLDLAIFTPIIGVNLAIIISIIGLFMVVLYLHNISSYLKPNILISKLIDQIFNALKPYEKRMPNQLSNDGNEYKSKVLEINSPSKGMLSYIDWDKVSKVLTELALEKQKNLWIDYSKSIGDWIEKQDNIAVVFEYNGPKKTENENEDQILKKDRFSFENENYNNDETKKTRQNKDNINKIKEKFLQSIEITDDRDLSRDPLFGIEVLRSVAVKSADLGDTDVIKSCITGLFRILHHALIHKEIIGIPFTITTEETKRKIGKIAFREKQSNNTEKTDNKYKVYKSKQKRLQSETTLKAIIKPKEILLDNIILVELSTIIDKILTARNVPLIHHLVNEYIAQCKNLIREDKYEEFRVLTDWCSSQLSLALKDFPLHLSTSFIDLLLSFKKDLEDTQPPFAKLFNTYMKDIVYTSAK
jgi:Predicted membrane protein (DUF2254)